MRNLAILASGSGSNAEAIMAYFEENRNISVQIVITNNNGAGVLDRAQKFDVKTKVIHSGESNRGLLLETLRDEKIDWVILAGYMKLIPEEVIKAFDGRMLNIHPALLPKFGGKGMYGMNVHKAVVAQNETESGMTIHFVNQEYDQGKIAFQGKVAISASDTAEDVAVKVLKLEHLHYPRIIEDLVSHD